jgi:methanogenic corrinoid protein MtbC1
VLGALAFAVALRRAGFAVAYLGADLPVDDWVTAARGTRAAVVTVPTHRDVRAADNVLAALRAAAPDVVVATGGGAAADRPGTLHLPDDLATAVDSLRQALTA